MDETALLLNRMLPASELRQGDVIDRPLVHALLDIDYHHGFAPDDTDSTVMSLKVESATFVRIFFEDGSAIRLTHDFDVLVVLRCATVDATKEEVA